MFIFMSYWSAIKLLLFISKRGLKGAQIPNISHIWKVYRIFIFHSILMSCFVFEWIVLRVFNSMSTEFSVFYDLQNLKNKMYFHQVLMQFLQVHTLMCYWRSINKCFLILTRGLKGAHLPNGLCWVLSVLCRPTFFINSHFIAHYKFGGWGDREFAFQCVLDTTLCDKDCPWLVANRWFFLGTVVSSTSKTDHHDITDILLNMVITTETVVYGYSSSRIWGGAVRRRYRKSRDRKRPWPEVTGSMFCTCPDFSRPFFLL